MKIYSILLFLCVSVSAFSQYPVIEYTPYTRLEKEGSRPAPAEFDSVYHVVVLPNDLLSGKYDYVRCKYGMRDRNTVEYHWDSWTTDGYFILVFTPHQMILYTNHENPNPNRIYWVAPITVQQYERVKTQCNFEYKWIEDHRGDKVFDRSYKNFSRLLRMINKRMGDLKFEIPSKKVFEGTGMVYLI